MDSFDKACKRYAENKVVNHPSHYDLGKFEAIDIIEAVLPAEWSKGFLMGNVIKYTLRAFKKNGLEDLKKCNWYLSRLIAKLDKEKAEREIE